FKEYTVMKATDQQGGTIESASVIYGLVNGRIAGGYRHRILAVDDDDRSDSGGDCHYRCCVYCDGGVGVYRRALDACAGSIVWCRGVDRWVVIAAIFALPPDAPTRRRTIHRLGADLCAGDSSNRSGYCGDHAELSRLRTTRAALVQCVSGRAGWVCRLRDGRLTACTSWEHAGRSGTDRAGYCTHGDCQLLTTDRHY